MKVLLAAAITGLFATMLSAQAPTTPLGIGRPATPDEIRTLDIDAAPDGHGLPDGRGTATDGATIYAAKCAGCHGPKGEGASAERLVGLNAGGSFAYAIDGKLIRTVGSYWPYATTLYDYTYRAMPFTQPGTLTPNETYSLVAYLLALNGLIPEGSVMDRTTLPKVAMPAHDHFVPDNRKGGPTVK
jgi:S-disulfanyl-L-cysteine oxidoreductase SoxD